MKSKSKTKKKGFTLIELIATIVILGIVAGIGSVAIGGIINSSKQKNYELLLENIQTASEMLYQNCRFLVDEADRKNPNHECYIDDSGYLTTTLYRLVSLGYLSSNRTKDIPKETTGVLFNPKDNTVLDSCEIKIKKFDDGINVTDASGCNLFGE